MPEGPEVRVVADVIRRAEGKIVSSVSVVENVEGVEHRFSKKRIANLAAIQHCELSSVDTFGKLINITFRNTSRLEFWQLLNTLGMSGSWAWEQRHHKHARLAIQFTDGTCLVFIDARCFGTIRIMTPTAALKETNKIGHDLLVCPMDAGKWAALQSHKSLANLTVGEALLVQRYFAGIGNIYKAETLYACQIDPREKVCMVKPSKWALVNTVAHGILKKAYALGGSSVESFQADGKDGQMQDTLAVYGRAKCPKGHKISTVEQDGRTTWFCEECIAAWKANEQNQESVVQSGT